MEISPPVLYELGLVPALGWLGEQFGRTHSLAVEVMTEGDDDSPDEVVQLTLFKVIRELLVNTVKHARATRADVRVRLGTLEVVGRLPGQRCRVRPDGPGGRRARSDAFGLFHVRERCAYLGGNLQIECLAGPRRRASW